jgi:hypothetical protein
VEDYFIAFVNPLPVKLTTFEGVVQEQNMTLYWVTTVETNADHFEIEHSLNGKTWNLVGTVAAKGKSNVQVNYAFEHKTPVNDQNLYRLKMVDLDDTFAFSKIISVLLNKNMTFTAYPNPVISRILIRNYEQVKQVAIYNAVGIKIVKIQKLSSEGIDVTRLQQGIYTISLIQFDGIVYTQKVLVIR